MQKFSLKKELSADIDVPTYDEVQKSILKAPDKNVDAIPGYNENGELACVEYKDTLSRKEALKLTYDTAVRFVSGYTHVIPGEAIIQEMIAKRAKTVLGHKFWEKKPYKYYWEYLFDKNKRLTETYGKIEGRTTFDYDEKGRLSKINNFRGFSKESQPVATVDISYDEQGRISSATKETARYGAYKYRDGEICKRSVSYTYNDENGYIAKVRSFIDGQTDGNYVEYHCNKENEILLEVHKNIDNQIISKKDYTSTALNIAKMASGKDATTK